MNHVECWPFLFLALSAPAGAYETDPLSDRRDPPGDGTDLANAYANELLAAALDRVNDDASCEGDDRTLRIAAAREIARIMTEKTTVPSRGRQPSMWFGAYAAWLESGPLDRRDYRDRTDLYSDVRLTNSPILRVFGPASTIQLAGVLLGTDKIDHFWVQGYDYFRVSHEGSDPLRAVRWGTRTELGIWGEATTGVFSYADLAANYDGYRFYTGLLREGSAVQRDEEGCLVLERPFDWSEWIDWHYDEALNPSVYTDGIAADVQRWTTSTGIDICNDLETWQAEWARIGTTEHVHEGYAGSRAPSRAEYVDLSDLCPALAMAAATEQQQDIVLPSGRTALRGDGPESRSRVRKAGL
jgi:hypothetical protein